MNNTIDNYLPIGTVVLLEGGTKRVMIISYLIYANNKDGKKVMYDYGACPYPEGVMDNKNAIGFNQTDIDKVIFKGLADDDEYQEFKAALDKYGEEMKENFKNAIEEANKKETEE